MCMCDDSCVIYTTTDKNYSIFQGVAVLSTIPNGGVAEYSGKLMLA